jgi:hypothetical protein
MICADAGSGYATAGLGPEARAPRAEVDGFKRWKQEAVAAGLLVVRVLIGFERPP